MTLGLLVEDPFLLYYHFSLLWTPSLKDLVQNDDESPLFKRQEKVLLKVLKSKNVFFQNILLLTKEY